MLVLNPHMVQDLGSFQYGVARCLKGRHSNRSEEGVWEYPPMAAVMEEAVFEEIGAYILKRQITVVYYIVMRLIMDLCKKTIRRPGAWVDRRWW